MPGQNSPFDINQRSLTLKVVLWVIFTTSLGLIWIDISSNGFTPGVWITIALSGFCLPGFYLNARGYFLPIAVSLSLLLLLAAGVNLYTREGLHDMGIVAFPVIIIICSLFFGKRGLIIFTLLSSLSISVVGFPEINGLLKPIPSNTNIGHVIALLIFILSTSILLWTLLDHAEKSRISIQKKEAELKETYDLTLQGFAKAYEFRGREPEGHSQRVMEFSLKLAGEIGLQGIELENFRRGVLLHDIGTLFIPDQIMLKPGPLVDEEWVIIKKHPERARDLLIKIPYLQPCLAIPYSHHENWDGSGYPQGLKGEDIPLPARIFALVDQWEELSSNRPFRPAWNPEKIMDHIRENVGILFDPDLTLLFIALLESGT